MQRKVGTVAGTRVDLHLHSYASGTAGNWWVRRIGVETEARESYTPPEEAYRMAKRAGMDFVTLTDHETIEGALTLTHHPDFFVGEEVSALFPDDGSHADVLVYGLDADNHNELQARRGNIYELVDYLREAGLVHVLAHPIYGMPKPVTRKQVEKRLVLFGLWEFINGSRPAGQNRLAREISTRTDGSDMRLLAARHGLPSPPHRRISGTGGSDDHGGVHGGATYTVVPEVGSPEEYLEALSAGESRSAGKDGSVEKLIHTGFKIAGEAIKEGHSETTLVKNLVRNVPLLCNFVSATENSGDKLVGMVPLLSRLGEPAIRAALVGRYEECLSGALQGTDKGFSVANFLGSIGSLVDGHLFAAPYAGVQGYFGREERKARNLRRELFPDEAGSLKVGVFADDGGTEDGIAMTYRRLLSEAGTDRPEQLRLVTCEERCENSTHLLRAVARTPVPFYKDLTLGVPSFLDVLEHVVEAGYDTLHVATPGPLGVAALVAGLALDLPVVGVYHTEFGRHAQALSGDEYVARIVDAAVRQFYERCSVVAVSSRSTQLDLTDRGYRVRGFEVLENDADSSRTLEKLIELHASLSGLERDLAHTS
jgi:hypothetical protein